MSETVPQAPFISVVVATFARPRQLQLCLESMARLEYPRDRFEVIVVDDGSPVPLDSIVEQFKSALPVKLLRQQNAGAAAARNFGAMHARGELIAFTDDDCCPLRDWLTTLAQSYAKNPNAAIGGITINDLPNNAFAAASQILIDYLYEYYHPAHLDRFFASNNLAVAKSHFDAIGGFDTRFPRAGAEDRDLCRRWVDAGFTTIVLPEAKVLHKHLMGPKEYLRQHFNYGRGAYHYHQRKASDRCCPSVRMEPTNFYFDLISYPFKRRGQFNSALLASLLFASQAANAFGFFFEGLRPTRSRHSSHEMDQTDGSKVKA